ncbi:phosphoribosylformylglycinamidine cyclo-ligase [Geoglobus ahangari]|uniref:Phosphoribosylformylglycinamidine cyclo-ligase n=1 Tax=Geoglobus ahangari TaxID=113653 RepID=A0A0F7IHW2_9EURY|nr:phosphoribosylformylglycinamidine cyclo-ligase [Geoglobus ahangari]AKG92349.1 phosphoribosylformylglycinamidine cyclo-ligase [Geoglobus ahangari]
MKSYADAGVDIKREERAVKSLISGLKFVRKGFGQPILTNHYASVIDAGEFGIAITTDGVGTKIKVAEIMNNFRTIGIDCVAMNVNDLYAINAEPVAMVDYIATNRPDEKIMAEIGEGLNKGCEMANMTLVGGETATLDIVNGWDLSGTVIGFVDKERMITGERIKPGDVIFAIPSSGIHSNGLTLARKLVEESGLSYFDKFENHTIGEELLVPTRIYSEVLEIARKHDIHGMAHITGGGLLNLKRLKKVKFVIDSPLKPQRIFTFLQELGDIDVTEMYRTFNMGMGFMLICDESTAEELRREVEGDIVGHVEEGEGVYLNEVRVDV